MADPKKYYAYKKYCNELKFLDSNIYHELRFVSHICYVLMQLNALHRLKMFMDKKVKKAKN